MRKMMNKVVGNMKVTVAKAAMLLKDKKGENYVDTAVKILIAVVIGALLLAGLYALFGDIVMPTLTRRIQEMFKYAGKYQRKKEEESMPRNAATQNNNTENMEQHVPFKVTITEHNPERGVLANADVNVAGIMTIRNVKIKQDDYGLTVTMPRTKLPHTELYKDSVYFADKSMKQQFDMAVETAYQESVLTPVLDQNEPEEGMEQEETTGMSMGM